MGSLADIAADQKAITAGCLDEPLSFFGIVVLAQIADGNIGTFARKSQGNGSTNSRIAPCDQRLLIF